MKPEKTVFNSELKGVHRCKVCGQILSKKYWKCPYCGNVPY